MPSAEHAVKRKARKLRRVMATQRAAIRQNTFLDLQATSCQDSDQFRDDSGGSGESEDSISCTEAEDFIAQNSDYEDDEDLPANAFQHGFEPPLAADESESSSPTAFQTDQHSSRAEHEIAVKVASRVRERIRSSPSPGLCSDFMVDKYAELPTVEDPALWRVRIENQAAADILFHLLLPVSPGASSVSITAAFFRECLAGHLYIEATSPEAVRRSLAGMSAFVRWREGILLVSIQERAQLLRMSEIDAFTSNWVRIKRGLYRHDLGCIRDQESFSSRVTVAVVPRLSYNPHPTPLKSGTKRQAPHARPSQALLDVDHARQIGNVQGSRSRNGYLKFQGMYFHGGLLIRQYSVHDLITKSVTPRYDEIRLFRASPCFDLSIIRNWQIADSLATLQAGNRVEILAGELKGSLALVNDIRDNSLRAELLHLSEDTGMCHEILQLSKHHVRKAFLPGDFVQVRHGRDAGSQGYVITTSELAGQPMVTFYRHGSLIENIPPAAGLPSNFNPVVLTESAFNVDFASPELSVRQPTELDSETAVAQELVSQDLARLRRGKDDMAGKTVMICGPHHYCGYRGVIQFTHVHLKQYAVRLEANNRIMMIDRAFLTVIFPNPVNSRSAMQLNPRQAGHDQRYAWVAGLAYEHPPHNAHPPPPPSTPRPTAEENIDQSLVNTPWDPDAPMPVTDSDIRGARRNGITVNWISSAGRKLLGKFIKVRILGTLSSDTARTWENGTYEGNVAYIVGEPIENSDGSHNIGVRLMRRTLVELSVPERYVFPVYPAGVNEKAVITVGEDAGTEGVVSDVSSTYWRVQVEVQPSHNSNSESELHPDHPIFFRLVQQDHMAVLGNRPSL